MLPPSTSRATANRCGTAFDVHHTLSCSKGGMVIARHNEVRDEIIYLAQRAFNSESVHVELLILQGHNRSERGVCQGINKYNETRGDAMIQGLLDRQAEAIIDIKIGDADAYSYKYDPMAALLDLWETINKNKHGKHCHDQRKLFSVCYFYQWNYREGRPSYTC